MIAPLLMWWQTRNLGAAPHCPAGHFSPYSDGEKGLWGPFRQIAGITKKAAPVSWRRLLFIAEPGL
ncbi:hypothetical protein EB230_07720 [Mesorhizobium sp. NZP2234]|nr:hypothetical protein EB230_07720 [Mesorhizobium sp. NZP2234]